MAPTVKRDGKDFTLTIDGATLDALYEFLNDENDLRSGEEGIEYFESRKSLLEDVENALRQPYIEQVNEEDEE